MLTESQARVLSVLATEPAQALNARQIAADAGITPETVRTTAKSLAYAGLASQVTDYPATWRITDAGRRNLTFANTDFPPRGDKGQQALQ